MLSFTYSIVDNRLLRGRTVPSNVHNSSLHKPTTSVLNLKDKFIIAQHHNLRKFSFLRTRTNKIIRYEKHNYHTNSMLNW